MKIVHISAYYIEDLAKGYQVYELVREQILLGHEVHIITSDKHNGIKNYVENTSKIGSNETLKVGKSDAESGAIIHRLNSTFTITCPLYSSSHRTEATKLAKSSLLAMCCKRNR